MVKQLKNLKNIYYQCMSYISFKKMKVFYHLGVINPQDNYVNIEFSNMNC